MSVIITVNKSYYQGVSWILELISTAVKIEHDSKGELCYLLLVLDLPNLLTVG